MSHCADVVEPIFSSDIAIPDRSMLFALQPVGIGTPHQESLLSLLVRTSHAHAVNPRLLIREIFPIADGTIAQLPSAAFFQRMAVTINGLSQYAQIFASAMEKLTGQSNLHHLTFLSWQELFPHNSQGFLARHPRWCPVCLEKQHRENGVTMFPLVWSLETYQICHIHLVPLESCCSCCGKMQPCIPSCPDLAFCAYCRRFLGGARVEVSNSDFKIWMAEALGDMVARQLMPNFVPTRERFQEFLREQVAVHTGGNRAEFCSAIGLNRFGASGWLNKGERPSITQFLTVCYGTKTLPVDIFYASPDRIVPMYGLRMPTEKLKERVAPPRLEPERRDAVEKILQEHLDTGTGQSITVIAKSLGVGRTCLRYWFPDLCKLLSEQHRVMAKRRSDELRRRQCMLVDEIVNQIQAEGIQPSKRKVDKLLQTKGITISQPHLMNAYRKHLTSPLG
jgi:transposase